jgi:hypothetical protein
MAAFWRKQTVQSEQPEVTYSKKLYAEFSFANNGGQSQLYAYSTVKEIRDQASFASLLLTPQSLKSIGEDINGDGLVDRWNVSLRVRRPASNLRQATLVLGFDYKTSKVV